MWMMCQGHLIVDGAELRWISMGAFRARTNSDTTVLGLQNVMHMPYPMKMLLA